MFSNTATTTIYTLSLHDALPIYIMVPRSQMVSIKAHQTPREFLPAVVDSAGSRYPVIGERSEEHTSELQSRRDLVCRLLLEKKKICTGCFSDARSAVHTSSLHST